MNDCQDHQIIFNIKLKCLELKNHKEVLSAGSKISLCIEHGGKLSSTRSIAFEPLPQTSKSTIDVDQNLALVVNLQFHCKTRTYRPKILHLCLRQLYATQYGGSAQLGLGIVHLNLNDIFRTWRSLNSCLDLIFEDTLHDLEASVSTIISAEFSSAQNILHEFSFASTITEFSDVENLGANFDIEALNFVSEDLGIELPLSVAPEGKHDCALTPKKLALHTQTRGAIGGQVVKGSTLMTSKTPTTTRLISHQHQNRIMTVRPEVLIELQAQRENLKRLIRDRDESIKLLRQKMKQQKEDLTCQSHTLTAELFQVKKSLAKVKKGALPNCDGSKGVARPTEAAGLRAVVVVGGGGVGVNKRANSPAANTQRATATINQYREKTAAIAAGCAHIRAELEERQEEVDEVREMVQAALDAKEEERAAAKAASTAVVQADQRRREIQAEARDFFEVCSMLMNVKVA